MIKHIKYILFLWLLFLISYASAQESAINNFTVQENLMKGGRIMVVAADEDGNPLHINGTYNFSINGFSEDLKFNDGIAVPSGVLNKSAFVYLKHKNESGTHSKLYYVIKTAYGINTLSISWLVLLAIPVFLIILGMMFRKMIIICLIIMGVIFYFNSSRGLGFFTFFETVYQGVRSLL